MTGTLNRGTALIVMLCCLTSAALAQWKEKVLYSFQGLNDGAVPVGGIVRDKAGNLYGATLNGGSSSCEGPGQCGVVYELLPPAQSGGAWTETILYLFKGHAYNDGASSPSIYRKGRGADSRSPFGHDTNLAGLGSVWDGCGYFRIGVHREFRWYIVAKTNSQGLREADSSKRDLRSH